MEFDLDVDGLFCFYNFDVYEEVFGVSMGIIYLFGKVSFFRFFYLFFFVL